MADKKTTRTVRIYTVAEAIGGITMSPGRQDKIANDMNEETDRRRFVREAEAQMDDIWYGRR
jgi:hypothetical protein